ncbi:MAG: methylated-DNA--[protein]-cysteine S-methyltransferase [Negativicutes bacterium]|nr:methylated-DNA--[protein]-cysteine S-methyltransferase [Negativicutes bacterium]
MRVIALACGGIPLRLYIDRQAIWAVEFDDVPPGRPGPEQGRPPGDRLGRECERQLTEYAAGRLRVFSLPLADRGTDWQRRVWRELSALPYGQTVSYGEIARRLGKPGAARAVAAACRANPWPVIVPCHRVISANGRLHGYAGGLARKRQLLRGEGIEIGGDE